MLLAVADKAFATTHYVDAKNARPTPHYTTWGTAANSIQQAVDAAAAGDGVRPKQLT